MLRSWTSAAALDLLVGNHRVGLADLVPQNLEEKMEAEGPLGPEVGHLRAEQAAGHGVVERDAAVVAAGAGEQVVVAAANRRQVAGILLERGDGGQARADARLVARRRELVEPGAREAAKQPVPDAPVVPLGVGQLLAAAEGVVEVTAVLQAEERIGLGERAGVGGVPLLVECGDGAVTIAEEGAEVGDAAGHLVAAAAAPARRASPTHSITAYFMSVSPEQLAAAIVAEA